MYYFVISRTKNNGIKIVEEGIVHTKLQVFQNLVHWKNKYTHVAITTLIPIDEDIYEYLEEAGVPF